MGWGDGQVGGTDHLVMVCLITDNATRRGNEQGSNRVDCSNHSIIVNNILDTAHDDNFLGTAPDGTILAARVVARGYCTISAAVGTLDNNVAQDTHVSSSSGGACDQDTA